MRINKGLLLLLFLLLVVSSGVLANENDSKLQEFYAPRFLGAGGGTSVLLPPASSTLNPASAALAQRTTFEGSYVGILGSDDTSSGWKGHVLNFGQTLPTKVGVFTWNGSYLSSGYDSLNTGKQFSVSGSFAKDVYPDTFVGVGLKTTLGEGPSFIAAGDLGLIRTKTSLLFLDDVRWSVVLQN